MRGREGTMHTIPGEAASFRLSRVDRAVVRHPFVRPVWMTPVCLGRVEADPELGEHFTSRRRLG